MEQGVDERVVWYRSSGPGQCRRSAARERERRREVRGQLGADVDLGPGDRMLEPEPARVEELALEAEVAGDPVDEIAADGQVDRLQVNPDLVRPPRLEPDVEEGVIAH